MRDFLLADFINVFHIEDISFYEQYKINKVLKFKYAVESNMLKDYVASHVAHSFSVSVKT